MQDGTSELRVRRLSNFATNGLPVGFEYFTINKNVRFGSLPLLGGLYSRTTYADLWAWIQEQPGYLISETEWQEKSQANNGNVPFYSTGDGSTTFRVPSLKCWVKSGESITEVGSYLEAGLPNLQDIINTRVVDGLESITTPEVIWGNDEENALIKKTGGSTSGNFNSVAKGSSGKDLSYFEFNASRYNPIYKDNFNKVQPESIVGLYCVIAFSTISNTGNLDVQTLYNKIIELEGKLENADSTPTGTILALLDDEVPEGYLPAEGAAISRTTYADLFNIIGTQFGEGDGSTTFNLPNLVGRFLEGNGTPGILKEPGLPNITGTLNGNAFNTHSATSASGALYVDNSGTSSSTLDGTQSWRVNFNASRSNSIYGAASTVQPPAVTVRFIIKY